MSMTREELRDSARRAFATGGLAPDAESSWATLTEMGWFMMTVAEDQGGLGLGREAAAAIHFELGRALVPGAVIAQMAAVEVLAASGQSALLEAAMTGEIVGLSLLGNSGGDSVACIPDADKASHFLIDETDHIRLVPADQCSYTRRESWDETRRLFDVEYAHNAGEIIVEGTAAWAVSEHLQSSISFALAADSLGGAEAALAMTVEYLKTRRQFDRPLAMFQALKHRVADLKTVLTAAEALLWSRATGEATHVQMGALKAHCAETYRRVAEEAIQLHGGIGLTLEHPCHLFLKRAFLNCALGGDADHHYQKAGEAELAKTATMHG